MKLFMESIITVHVKNGIMFKVYTCDKVINGGEKSVVSMILVTLVKKTTGSM